MLQVLDGWDLVGSFVLLGPRDMLVLIVLGLCGLLMRDLVLQSRILGGLLRTVRHVRIVLYREFGTSTSFLFRKLFSDDSASIFLSTSR